MRQIVSELRARTLKKQVCNHMDLLMIWLSKYRLLSFWQFQYIESLLCNVVKLSDSEPK